MTRPTGEVDTSVLARERYAAACGLSAAAVRFCQRS
jgi:hypothetical protein